MLNNIKKFFYNIFMVNYLVKQINDYNKINIYNDVFDIDAT